MWKIKVAYLYGTRCQVYEPGGWGGAAKVKFFGQKPTAKNEKERIYFLYLLNEKTDVILSSEIKCPKSRIFTSN